jgi:Na+-driven multidrug efflux pump
MYASVAELLVNVILSVLFIQLWGIEGVAFATVIAFALQKIICLIYNKSKLGISAEKYVPIRTLAFYSLAMIIVFCFVF